MNKKSAQIAVYIVVLFMMTTGIVYFVAASEEIQDASGELSPPEANENEAREQGEHESKSQTSESMGLPLDAELQTTLFAVSGAAYIPVGLWILKSKQKNKTPYVIAIVGSLSLILLYVASRTISLPIVGIQDDVGSIDILSKVLQGGIIAGSAYVLTTLRPKTKSTATIA
jgi:hypothetical protein